jgi:hypothetical protein
MPLLAVAANSAPPLPSDSEFQQVLKEYGFGDKKVKANNDLIDKGLQPREFIDRLQQDGKTVSPR